MARDPNAQMIIEVEVTVLDIDKLRLKFHGLPGDVGPDLIMNFDLARTVIAKLHAVLPEGLAAKEEKGEDAT